MLQIEMNGLFGPTKNKSRHANPWRDSYAADRGYAAEIRP